jgi:hypothetical protein
LDALLLTKSVRSEQQITLVFFWKRHLHARQITGKLGEMKAPRNLYLATGVKFPKDIDGILEKHGKSDMIKLSFLK